MPKSCNQVNTGTIALEMASWLLRIAMSTMLGPLASALRTSVFVIGTCRLGTLFGINCFVSSFLMWSSCGLRRRLAFTMFARPVVSSGPLSSSPVKWLSKSVSSSSNWEVLVPGPFPTTCVNRSSVNRKPNDTCQ